MQVLHGCCCGLDIHKRFVVACVLTTAADGRVAKVTRTFSTMTDELLALLDWLTEVGCTHVAMESTSAYWRPIYNLLEGHLTVLVANAYHIKAVPGRKTDVRDAEWIADLLRHGLLRGSFIPSPEQRQLRDLTRYRTHLVEERARVTNRLQMVLEDANVKLAAVVSTHATTNRLWMSNPQQQPWSTCIVHLLRDAPVSAAAGWVSDSLRYSPACYPRSGATTGDASGHPGPTVDRLVARESTDLRCRRPAASVGIFILGDGPQAQG